MAEHKLNPYAPRSTIRIPLFYLGAAVLVWAAVATIQGVDRIGTYPLLMLRHYAAALLFLLLAICPLGSWITQRIGHRGAAGWGWASAISYGVYVIHFPILIQWHVAQNWIGFVLALAVVIALAELGDRRLNTLMRGGLRRRKRETG